MQTSNLLLVFVEPTRPYLQASFLGLSESVGSDMMRGCFRQPLFPHEGPFPTTVKSFSGLMAATATERQ